MALKPRLKWGFMKERAKAKLPSFFKYDKSFDCFMLLLVSPSEETVVHYVDDNVALLYRPKDKQIVGLQIEGFEKSFLPKHAALARTWRLSENTRPFEFKDAGELILQVNRIRLKIVREVAIASRPFIGRDASVLEEAVAY